MDNKFYGQERYYDMWYELFKESLRGMCIGTGGSVAASGEINALNTLKTMLRGGV